MYREERAQLQGLSNDNKSTAKVTLESLVYKNKDCFAISLSDHRQTNHKGMFGWVADLAFVKKKIVFTLNEQGFLGELQNHAQIYAGWKSAYHRIMHKHQQEKHSKATGTGIDALMKDPAQLAAALRYAPPYVSLFMGINGKEYTDAQPSAGYRLLPNFIGVKSLPVNTEEVLQPAGADSSTMDIEVTGKLDDEHIDQDKISSLVRLLRDHPRASAEVKLRYNESIKLDKDCWPVQSICMNLIVIPGFLFRQETTILKEI